jgi:PAS domain S-box-containing protein
MITGPLRILHVEDDSRDASLVEAVLAADGLVVQLVRVQTRDGFVAALETDAFDLILSDYHLPSFDGAEAQALAGARRPDTPFILLSGTLGEELAVERVKAGATDYIIKQRIERLPSAVRRALAETGERRQRKQAEAALRALNLDLERRIAERTSELKTANDRLAARERALVESEGRLQAILDNSPAVIYVKDVDGRYVFVNKQFESVIGRTRASVSGRRTTEVLPSRVAERLTENDQAVVASGDAMDIEEVVPTRDGPRVYMSSKFPLFGVDGRIYAVCGISTDITDRKGHEEQLKLARFEAERANRAKSEFLSRMSHDLRTPLNAVLGFAQLLDLDSLSGDQRDAVKQILKGGAHLLDLINEVLEIARIEAGHLSLSPEPVRVDEALSEAVALVRSMAAARAITIDVAPPTHLCVHADRQRLQQVLLNLLSNAVKYDREGGTMTISVASPEENRCRISVSDTGQGIPRRKLHLLFNAFERLGAESTGTEGTGLGLVVAKSLIEAMNGEIGVSSVVGSGSTFWIELPITEEPEAAVAHMAPPTPARATTPAAAAGTLLYIEDNAANVSLLERVMARRPQMRMVHKANGADGIEAAMTVRPDIIFLDMHLPDMHGEEVLRQLNASPVTAHVPVYVLSADAMPSNVKRVLAGGAVAYLTKPLDVVRVLKVIDEAMEHPRQPAGDAVNER